MKNTTTSYPKKYLSVSALIVAITFFGAINLSAQDRVHVDPDNHPLEIGALNRAIEQNGGDVIYVLQNGATYFLESGLEFEHKLHVEAEEYPTDNPPIIRPGTDELGNSSEMTRYGGDVIMRGVFFYGMDDMGSVKMSQRTAAEGIHLLYQHCYFMGGENYFWWLGAMDNTVRIEDSQLANAGRHTSAVNQRFLDTRGNDTDSLIVINSSIYNINFHILRDGGARVNHVIFDHFTVVNHAEAGLNLHLAENVSITNSLFYNYGLDGDWEAADVVGDDGPHYKGERYYGQGGFINITPYDQHFEGVEDAPSDEDRSIVIKNNNFGALPPQGYLDNWEEFNDPDIDVNGRGSEPWGTDPQWEWDNPNITPEHPAWAVRDTIRLVRIKQSPMDSTLKAWAVQGESWVTIENNIEEELTITDMPDDMVDFTRAVWFGLELPHHYDRWDEISEDSDDFFSPDARFYHPGPGTPTDTEGPTSAWFRNLAYNTDSESYRLADNNYPVGNLNFFPELREMWEQGEVIEPTSAEDYNQKSDHFRLVGNYPNPFNPTTNIVFELGSSVNVKMEIFNVIGQRVETMDLGLMSTGQHNVTFDGSSLTSGVYIVRMMMGTHVETHQMSLIK